MTEAELPKQIPECGFCGKAHNEVGRLIVGGGRYAICDECILLTISIMAWDNREAFEKMVAEARAWKPDIR